MCNCLKNVNIGEYLQVNNIHTIYVIDSKETIDLCDDCFSKNEHLQIDESNDTSVWTVQNIKLLGIT